MDKRIYKGSSAGQLFPLVDSETSTKDCYFVSGHVIQNDTKGMDFVRKLLSLPLDQNTDRGRNHGNVYGVSRIPKPNSSTETSVP